ncbi:hypothetical protein BDZ89DRAFT_1110291 [Hymenopellis radicata]|nr:hypothetical protein BDZ89DRAFT_1110291 [Hymenopellis radicata]
MPTTKSLPSNHVLRVPRLPSSYLNLPSDRPETASSPKVVDWQENRLLKSDTPDTTKTTLSESRLHNASRCLKGGFTLRDGITLKKGELYIESTPISSNTSTAPPDFRLAESPPPSSYPHSCDPIVPLASTTALDLPPRKRLLERFREDSVDPDCFSSTAFIPTTSGSRADISTSSTNTKCSTTLRLPDCTSQQPPADVSRSEDFDDLFVPELEPRFKRFFPETFDLKSFDFTVNDSDYSSTDECESEDESEASPTIPVTPLLTGISVPVVPTGTASLSPALEATVWMTHDAVRAELGRHTRETMWGLGKHKRVPVKEEMAVRLAWKDDANTGDRGVPYY